MNEVIINDIIKKQDKYNEKGIVSLVLMFQNCNTQYNCFLLK